jgi:hypothetical protein
MRYSLVGVCLQCLKAWSSDTNLVLLHVAGIFTPIWCICGSQVDALRTVVGQLEVSTAAAEAEYNRQLARNKDELTALRQSRGQELTGMLVSRRGDSKRSRQ